MKSVFHNKKISGVLSVLPNNMYRFEDEVLDPTDAKSKRLKRIIGFGTRRCARETTTLSDLLLFGFNNLIQNGKLVKDDIGAIIVVTLCPDFFLPQISSIIHGELGLSRDVFCIDIPDACCGFITGLLEAFMLLDHLDGKKAVVCTGEVLNRKSPNDEKMEKPHFGGDIANITIVENCNLGYNNDIFAEIYNDGTMRENLVIRYGGFRNPNREEAGIDKRKYLPCSMVEMDG